MINTQAIKDRVLKLAITGQLTEQLPDDGNASDLLRRIQDERVALINNGLIKKGKPTPAINDEEIPFAIPDNWIWVRLSQICAIINGDRGKNYPAKSTLSSEGIPFISALNLDGRGVVDDNRLLCMSEEQYERLSNGKLQKQDIVICIRGSLGKHGRYPFDRGAIASSLVISRLFYMQEIMGDYEMLWLDSPMFPGEISKYDGGTAQPNLAAKNLEKFLIPLPPIAEQERIVSKTKAILALLDMIDESQQQYANDVAAIRRKIIDAGIRGRLTKQCSEDGNAEELHQLIQNEKDELIKRGELRRPRSLPGFDESEVPYAIPKTWKWVRFADLINLTNGLASRGTQGGSPHAVLRLADLTDGGIDTTNIRMINLSDAEYESHIVKENDLIFIRVNGSRNKVGKAYLYDSDAEVSYCDHLFCGHRYSDRISPEYIMLVCYSDMAWKQIDPFIKTTAGQNTISQGNLGKMLIPLPPEAEQKRIVECVNELLVALPE